VAHHDFLPRQYFLEFAPFAERAGVLSGGPQGLVFSTAAPDLAPGARIVQAGAPAPALRVVRRLGPPSEAPGAPLVLVRGAEATAYAVEAEAPLDPDALPAIGVAGEVGGLALTSSECTSAEGLHLSLAIGSDAHRARVWSAYLALGYEVEPSCADGEWAE
jgi:hypothetical protein